MTWRHAILAICAAVAVTLTSGVRTAEVNRHDDGLIVRPGPILDPPEIATPIEQMIDELRRATHPGAWQAILGDITEYDSTSLRIAVMQAQPQAGTPDVLDLVAPQFVLTEIVLLGDLEQELREAALTRLAELDPFEAFRASNSVPSTAERRAFDGEISRQLALALPAALGSGQEPLRSTGLRILQAHPDMDPLPTRELAGIVLLEQDRELRMSALECLAIDDSSLAHGALLAALADPDELISELAEELLAEESPDE